MHPTCFDLARSLRRSLLAIFCSVCFCLPLLVRAQETTKRPFDIPADTAEKTLKVYSQQSGRALIMGATAVEGVRTNEVRGEYTPRDALDLMLANTKLEAVEDAKSGSLAVRKVSELKNVNRAITEKSDRPGKTDTGSNGTEGDGNIYRLEVYRVTAFSDRNVDIPRGINDPQPYHIFDSVKIERSGAQDVEDFLHQQLTMNTTSAANSQLYAGLLGATSSINLRGLGANETLILINGRRSAGVSWNGTVYQPDLNSLPLSAIERIEVLPTSASAIYGGAAVGGVVNVVLKKDYHGGQLVLGYSTPVDTDAPRKSADFTYGATLGSRTQIMLTGHYGDGKSLLVGERRGVIESNIQSILKNNAAYLYSPSTIFQGATPNIAASTTLDLAALATGVIRFIQPNLVLKDGTALNSPITSVPAGTSSSSAIGPGLVANAGTYNISPSNGTGQYGLGNNVVGNPRTKSIMATIRREMTNSVEFFVEGSYQSNSSQSVYNPINLTGGFTVPAAAPTNPFRNQSVVVDIPTSDALMLKTASVTQVLTTGAILKLPGQWRAEMDYTWSHSRLVTDGNTVDSTALKAALASGVINPFVDTIAFPLDLKNYYAPNFYRSEMTMNDASIRASGPVEMMKWITPVFSLGIEHRKESLGQGTHTTTFFVTTTDSVNQVFFPQQQTTDSGYAEATLPLISAKNQLPFVRSLDAQVAVRTERYVVDVGTPYAYLSPASQVASNPAQGLEEHTKYTATSPTYALKYAPLDSVALRASYSNGFVPPTAAQLVPDPRPGSSFGRLIFDPVTNTSYSSYQVTGGGNPNLKPQTSDAWTFGAIWEPRSGLLHGARFNLEYFEIKQPNYITLPTAQQIVGDPSHADRITRDPNTHLITLVDVSNINAALYKTAGFDVSASYEHKYNVGTVGASLGATITTKDRRQYTIGSPLLNYLGYVTEGGEARLKGNAGLSFERGAWRVSWLTYYYGRYLQALSPGSPVVFQNFNGVPQTKFTAPQGGFEIPSQTFHDVSFSYRLDKLAEKKGVFGKLFAGMTIQGGIKNVFNRSPAFDAAASPYFYSTYGNIRLREWWVHIKKEF